MVNQIAMGDKLREISLLPFNNFSHYLRCAGVDVSEVSGSEDAESLLGGNCIYKSILAGKILKSVTDRVYSVVEQGGTHHALLYRDDGLYFLDPCLYMRSAVLIDADFVCDHTLLANSGFEANFIALEFLKGDTFTFLWNFNSSFGSKSWDCVYDFSILNSVVTCDWGVESFKEKPNALIFRFLNVDTQQLQQISVFLKTGAAFISKSFSGIYTGIGDMGTGFKDSFQRSVGIGLSDVLDCMQTALPLAKGFNRFI